MKVTYQKPQEITLNPDAEAPVEIETETLDLTDKFIEYLHALEEENYRVQKIAMHHEMYHAMTQSFEYAQTRQTSPDGTETFYGVEIESKDLGHHSIADFIIYTDKKTVHSDMIDKDFVEDLDVEQLLHKTNQKIDDRQKDL